MIPMGWRPGAWSSHPPPPECRTGMLRTARDTHIDDAFPLRRLAYIPRAAIQEPDIQ